MNLFDLTMPLDWEWMPDEVFPTATHFLIAPRRHPAKGLTMGNESGPCILLPSQFEEPVAVTKDNIKDYLGEPDFPKKEEICAGKLASKCQELGL